jgi:hypothetical protein
MPSLGKWLTTRRIAGIAGLGYFIGVAIENQEVLTSPTLSSSVADIRAAYADQAFAIVTSFAGALALLSYAAFVAALYIWLRQSERVDEPWATIALVGGIAGPVVAAAGLSADAILIAGSDAGANDDVAGALFDFYLLCRIISGVFVALFLGGIGIASLRSGILPRPLAWLALAIAAPMALAPLAAFDQEPGLETAVGIAFAAQTLWIFLASMWLTVADGLAPLAFIRRSAFLLLVLAAGLIGIALLAAPGATGEFFAWQLKPEPLAAFAGGVYVGSATAYALALAYSARQVRGLVLGAVVLSVSVFIITLAHSDQFDFDRLQAIMWVVLFAAFSLVTIGLFLFEREEEGARPARLPGWVRAVFGAVAIAGGALALALWIDPTGLAGPSPFDLPPLGGRFAGSWIALLAVLCGWAAVRDRVDEARLSAFALIALPAGALVAALRTIEQLEPAGAVAAYVAVAALLGLAGAMIVLTSNKGPASPRHPGERGSAAAHRHQQRGAS